MTPRPLPTSDGHPAALTVVVAMTIAAATTVAWVGYAAARSLLRRLP